MIFFGSLRDFVDRNDFGYGFGDFGFGDGNGYGDFDFGNGNGYGDFGFGYGNGEGEGNDDWQEAGAELIE